MTRRTCQEMNQTVFLYSWLHLSPLRNQDSLASDVAVKADQDYTYILDVLVILLIYEPMLNYLSSSPPILQPMSTPLDPAVSPWPTA